MYKQRQFIVSQNIIIACFLTLSATLICLATSCSNSAIDAQNHTAHADSIVNQATLMLNTGSVKKAPSYLDLAYRTFLNPGPADRWKKYHFLYKFYLDYLPDTMRARVYTDTMRLMIKDREQLYKVEYANTLFARGDVLMAGKKYTEAFRLYYDGRNYAQENLDTCSLAPFTAQLAMIKYNQFRFPEAIRYFKKALAENSHCKDSSDFDNRLRLPQYVLNMTGLSYVQTQHNFDSAVVCYQQALSILDRWGPKFPLRKKEVQVYRGIIFGALGDVYMWQFKDSLASHYLMESIRINDRPGYNKMDALSVMNDLAYLYIRTSKLSQAKEVIRQMESKLNVLEISQSDKEGLTESLYKTKEHYYEKTHKIDSAYSYSKLFDSYVNSVKKTEKGLRETDMEGTFKNTEQQYRLALLNRDNRLKSFYLLAAVLFSLITVLGLLMFRANLKLSRNAHSQIKDQYLQMQKAFAALEQSQADNTRMMQIVAHDLRNPVGNMYAIADIILDSKTLSEENRMMLDMIKISAKNSLELISDLLQVHTQVEELKKESVDLSQMLNYCIDLSHHKAREKGQIIILNAIKVTIPASREKLWRVVSNLITNAIKFSPAGAIIHVELWQKDDHIFISVKDPGIGIPNEIASKVFDMFTEVKRQGTAGEQAFGLGLSISKQIVEAHGGKIWFESEPNTGTTFFVDLPVEAKPK